MSEGFRIVVAPDKFKGSLTAGEAASALERGLRAVPACVRDLVTIPMADGGEGTVAVFLESGARAQLRRVEGPLGAPVDATFALTGDGLAVLEMASASGLLLVGENERDPLRASSYGTGELIAAALDRGATRIVLGIGGSATSDGGAGMLAALGVRFLDAAGEPLPRGGAPLARVATIDASGLDPRLATTTIAAACDVDSPLGGPQGAAHAFAAQKGATRAEVEVLETALTRFADVTAATIGADYRNVRGTGAAGGLGFGLLAYLSAALRPGVEVVAQARGLAEALKHADVCMTGEGRIDAQTLRGKTVAGVVRLALARSVPVIAFAGSLDRTAEAHLVERGLTAAFPLTNEPMTLDAAVRDAATLLAAAGARVGRVLALHGLRP